MRKYWADSSEAKRAVVRDAVLTLEGTHWQYAHGVKDPDAVAPETYALDTLLFERGKRSKRMSTKSRSR